MASRAKGGDQGVGPCASSGRHRTNSPPSTSLHPLDGGGGKEPGTPRDWKAVGFDIGGKPAIQA